MQKSNAPTKLTVAFASGSGAGPVNTVPLTPGATPGTASYQTGFTSVNMEPIASGGVPPFGADFNGVFKAATTAQIWQQSGYMYAYDSAFASNANIGGYPSGSVLMMGSGNGLWINKTDNNTHSPDTTGSVGWVGLPAAGAYALTTTGGTKTPDPSLLGVTTILVSGALTSNATIVLPLTAGARWIIQNNTTGSYTLTVQGATGAGVAITQGSALTVFTDGTSYFAASSNLSGAYLPINGTAVAATKLATARAFSVTGLATATGVNFDGTGNVVLNVIALDVPTALGYTPANDASVVHIAGTETITGAKTYATGVSFGTGVASSATDLSRHIALYGTVFGFNVTASNLNYVAAGSHTFYSGSTQVGKISNTGVFTAASAAFTGTLSAGATTLSGTLNGTSAAFTGALSAGATTITGLLTCTTFNGTSSDRRLKRNIRKADPRPLHRSIPYVSFERIADGSRGRGAIAQKVQKFDPVYVGTFEIGGKKRLSIDQAGMAYEQAMWAGDEVDRLTQRVAKLERALDSAKIEPRKRGFCRRVLEAIW